MEVLILTCSIISGLISLFAIALSLTAIIDVRALRNSTHRVEWIPLKDPYKNEKDDVEDFESDPTEGLNL